MTSDRAHGVLRSIVELCKSIDGDLDAIRSQLHQLLGTAESLVASEIVDDEWDDLHGHGADKSLFDLELAQRAVEQVEGYLKSATRLVS